MKKLFAMLMALSLLCLCACTPTGGAADTTAAGTTAGQDVFMAGFGEANITPDFTVQMTGYGN